MLIWSVQFVKCVYNGVVFFREQIPCNVVTALIQYFLLAAFCWMMCEGIMLYLMLVVVFTTLSKKWWFFLLLGWGQYYLTLNIHISLSDQLNVMSCAILVPLICINVQVVRELC